MNMYLHNYTKALLLAGFSLALFAWPTTSTNAAWSAWGAWNTSTQQYTQAVASPPGGSTTAYASGTYFLAAPEPGIHTYRASNQNSTPQQGAYTHYYDPVPPVLHQCKIGLVDCQPGGTAPLSLGTHQMQISFDEKGLSGVQTIGIRILPPNHNQVQYSFSQGDATNPVQNNGAILWHNFNAPGRYVVFVQASDQAGNTTTWIDSAFTVSAPICGNNIREGNEACDGSAGVQAGQSCRTNCTIAPSTGNGGRCGTSNGSTVSGTPTQLCANGNSSSPTQSGGVWRWTCSANSISAACSAVNINAGTPTCGNNVTEAGEECDGASTPAGRSCDASCNFVTVASGSTPVCGSANGTSSSSAPTTNLCTAGTPTPVGSTSTNWLWSCQLSGQSANCTSSKSGGGTCGNTLIEASEQCDDGNAINGDGCNSSCQRENLPIQIIGISQAAWGISTSGTSQSIGDLQRSEMRATLYRNLAALRAEASPASCTPSQRIISSSTDWALLPCARQSGTILYVRNADVTLFDTSGTVQIPEGARTIVVDGGDIIISSNIAYQDTGSLGLVALRDKSTLQTPFNTKGVVRVAPNVINAVGALYADGPIVSTNSDGSGIACPATLTASYCANSTPSLINQLYWKGSISSANTIGGSDTFAHIFPSDFGRLYVGFSSSLRRDLSYILDLNYLRKHSSTSGGLKAQDIDASNHHPVIIRYDSQVMSNPPPFFSTSANTQRLDASY